MEFKNLIVNIVVKIFAYKRSLDRHTLNCDERKISENNKNDEMIYLKHSLENANKSIEEYKIKVEELKLLVDQLKEDKQEMKYQFEKEKTQLLSNILDKTSNQLQAQTTEIIKTTLAPKSTTVNNNCTTNNIQMNVLNLSSERIRPAVDSYTIEHYLKGAEGMVEWMVEKVLTDEDGQFLYVCTDKNRKHFFFLNENKEKVEDIKAQKLLAAITPEISDKLRECKKTRNEEIVEKFFGETQAHDDRIMLEKKKNKKLYDEALGSKMLNKLVEKIYT